MAQIWVMEAMGQRTMTVIRTGSYITLNRINKSTPASLTILDRLRKCPIRYDHFMLHTIIYY